MRLAAHSIQDSFLIQQVISRRLRLGLPQIARFLQSGKPGSPLAVTRHLLRQATPERGISPDVCIRFGEILQLPKCSIVGAARCASQLCIYA